MGFIDLCGAMQKGVGEQGLRLRGGGVGASEVCRDSSKLYQN